MPPRFGRHVSWFPVDSRGKADIEAFRICANNGEARRSCRSAPHAQM